MGLINGERAERTGRDLLTIGITFFSTSGGNILTSSPVKLATFTTFASDCPHASVIALPVILQGKTKEKIYK